MNTDQASALIKVLDEIRDAIIEQNAILESIRDSILDLPERIIKSRVPDDEGWWED